MDLLGKHMGADQTTALAYFEVLVQASRDSGVSVRKRAVRILWDCCILSHGFPKETEACVAVLQRANDAEQSIQDLVGRMFDSLWICAGALTAPGTSNTGLEELSPPFTAYHNWVISNRFPIAEVSSVGGTILCLL